MEANQKSSKGLNIALWVVQVGLGGMFMMAGIMKATQPVDQLVEQMAWAGDIPSALLRFIGITEFLGGAGVILPAMFRVQPLLTPLAAFGLAVIMLFAMIFHGLRGEVADIGLNLIIGLAAMFVAWGRYRKVPIGRNRD